MPNGHSRPPVHLARRVAALAAAAASLSLGAAAQAAPPSLPPQAMDHGDFYTLSGKADDKAVTIERLERALDTASPASRARAHSPTARAREHPRLRPPHRLPVEGGHVQQHLREVRRHDLASFLETSATVSGSSRTAWLGTCPFNANTVTLRDEVCFDSIGFSVSVGGGGFSGSGGGCGDWSASVGSAWYINHSYSGIKGSGSLINPIWRVRQSSAGTFKFGTNLHGRRQRLEGRSEAPMSKLGVRTDTPARLRGRRPRAPRAVPAVLVCLTARRVRRARPRRAGTAGGAGGQRLLDALTPAHPFWGFRAAGRPALLPLADAVVGLRDSDGAVPGEAAGAVRSFWDPAIGLFADRRASVSPLASTWPAVRALTAEHLDAAHAGAMVEAVTARAGPGGIAWEPGGRPDPLASLYAARVLAALPGATAREALVTLAAALPCPRRAGAADAATALQARLLAGASCPVGPPLRARAERALRARARAWDGRRSRGCGRSSERRRCRARGSGRAARRLRARAGARDRGHDRKPARGRALGASSALALAGATAIRMRVDLARAAGLVPRLTAAERDALGVRSAGRARCPTCWPRPTRWRP